MDIAARLTLALVSAGIPIVGVSRGNDPDDRSQWIVHFSKEATAQHKADAAALLATFDPTSPSNVDAEKASAAQAVITPALRVFYLWAYEKFLGKLPTDAERAADLARMVELFKQFG